jgi:hypothetical protein
MDNLLAVDAGENMSKGALGPEDWLPGVGVCGFVSRWIAVKRKWDLAIDRREQSMLERLVVQCARDLDGTSP